MSAWTVDASGLAIPQNSTEWRAFLDANGMKDWSVPNGIHLMQDTKGSMSDELGSSSLSLSEKS